MNREEIIAFAREAGGLPDPMVFIGAYERFAALVAAAERNRIWTQEHWTEYERSIAAAEREACGRVKAAKPRKLKSVGRGMLLDEQQFCFDKGWREGAASVRAAIRARGQA